MNAQELSRDQDVLDRLIADVPAPLPNRAARRQAEREEAKTPPKKYDPSKGPTRKERRLKKYKPEQYANLLHDNDPRARRTHIRRWIYIFSPKMRAKFATGKKVPASTATSS